MVLYKPSAPAWMTAHGVAALALMFADVLPSFIAVPAEHADVLRETHARVAFWVPAIWWPMTAIVLANLRRTRAACALHAAAQHSCGDVTQTEPRAQAALPTGEDADFAALRLTPAMKTAGVRRSEAASWPCFWRANLRRDAQHHHDFGGCDAHVGWKRVLAADGAAPAGWYAAIADWHGVAAVEW